MHSQINHQNIDFRFIITTILDTNVLLQLFPFLVEHCSVVAAAAADDRLPHFWVWQEQKCFNKGVKRSKVARLHMVSFCQDDDKGKEVLDCVRFDLWCDHF